MKIKQGISEQPMDWRRNQMEKNFLIYWNKWNGNTTYQNLWDTVKAVLKRKFIAIINAYIKKKRSQINNLILYPKELEREKQPKP